MNILLQVFDIFFSGIRSLEKKDMNGEIGKHLR